MARSFAKITAAIWSDQDWRNLSAAAQRMYLLLLSQPRLSLAGHLDVIPGRWAGMARDTSTDDIAIALLELADAGYIVTDGDELVIRSFSIHDIGNGAVNRNLLRGFWSAWESILSPVLRRAVIVNMPRHLFEYDEVEPPDEAQELWSELRFELRLEERLEPPSPSPFPLTIPSPSDHRLTTVSVDNVLAAIVELRMKEATKAGTVRHPVAYRQSIAADVEALRPQAESAVAKFDADAHAIAEYVEGRRDARWLTQKAATA